MSNFIENMKRVNAILRACQDDSRLRKKVAEETAKYVRDKSPGKEREFELFLSKTMKKLNIKLEVTNGKARSQAAGDIDKPAQADDRGRQQGSSTDTGDADTRPTFARTQRRGRRTPS